MVLGSAEIESLKSELNTAVLAAEKRIAPGLGVFCKAQLAEWVNDWVKALRDKGVKYSSLANYTNNRAL